MLKKTSASAGLVIVTAAGALLTSSPAYALDGLVGGSYVHIHHRSHHRNRNWNGNHHHARIFIRIYIYNKNNNHAVAVARPERRGREFVGDTVPVDGTTGAGVGAAASRQPATATPQEVAPASTPAAETNQATPVSTTPDQNSTVTRAAAAPSAAPAAAPMTAPKAAPLDEAATG